MIVIRLKGGLGNQMFQYAFGKGLAKQWNDDLMFSVEFSPVRLRGCTPRKLELEAFDLKLKKYTNRILNNHLLSPILQKCSGSSILGKISEVDSRFWIGVLRSSGRYPKLVIERNGAYNPSLFNERFDAIFDGYWGSWKYFSNVEEELKQDFQLKDMPDVCKNILDTIQNEESVSVHVRRGDYLTIPSCSVLSDSYYFNSFKHIKSRLENPKYIVFGEDADWAIKNLKIPDAEYVNLPKGTSPAVDMILMSKCKHNIIANSSYSWWSAWLNRNPRKIVLYPKPWFKGIDASDDVIMPGWEAIDSSFLDLHHSTSE